MDILFKLAVFRNFMTILSNAGRNNKKFIGNTFEGKASADETHQLDKWYGIHLILDMEDLSWVHLELEQATQARVSELWVKVSIRRNNCKCT